MAVGPHLPLLCTCSTQHVAAILTLLWECQSGQGKTLEQPNREFSLYPLHTKDREAAHKAIHHLPYTDGLSVSKPQTNLDQSRKEVTDMNKHAGKGWKLSFPSPYIQESYCASQGCKIKKKKSTAGN